MFIEMLFVALAFGISEEEARQEVICAETGFSRAAEAKDRELFLSFVHPDARFVTSGVARGREEIGESWSAVFDPEGPAMRWRPAIVEVSSDGQLAISRGPFRSVSTDENGARVESWGHFISTWRRDEDGVWQVMFDSGGDVGITPTAAEVKILESEPECP